MTTPTAPAAMGRVDADGPGIVSSLFDHWKLAAAIVASFLFLGVLYTVTQPSRYAATVRVSLTDPQSVPFPRSNARLQDDLARFLAVSADTVESSAVIERAAAELDMDPSRLSGVVSVASAANASALDISALAGSPAEAEARADAIVSAFAAEFDAEQTATTERSLAAIDEDLAVVDAQIDESREDLAGDSGNVALQTLLESNLEERRALQNTRSELTANARALDDGISSIEQSGKPAQTSPKPLLNLAVAGAMGVLTAALACWLLSSRRPQARSSLAPARLLGAPLLARVPALSPGDGALQAPPQPTGEAFNVLTSALGQSASGLLVVTGVSRGDGSTTTCLNLATSLAAAGKRVAVVDADLRDRAATTRLGFDSSPGLADLDMEDEPTPLEHSVGGGYAKFRFVPAGQPAADDPGTLLRRSSIIAYVSSLCAYFDVVIVDTPPLTGHSDAVVIAERASSVVLVVRYGALLSDLAVSAPLLAAAGSPVVGYVFNRAGRTEPLPDDPSLATLATRQRSASGVTIPVAEQLSEGHDPADRPQP